MGELIIRIQRSPKSLPKTQARTSRRDGQRQCQCPVRRVDTGQRVVRIRLQPAGLVCLCPSILGRCGHVRFSPQYCRIDSFFREQRVRSFPQHRPVVWRQCRFTALRLPPGAIAATTSERGLDQRPTRFRTSAHSPAVPAHGLPSGSRWAHADAAEPVSDFLSKHASAERAHQQATGATRSGWWIPVPGAHAADAGSGADGAGLSAICVPAVTIGLGTISDGDVARHEKSKDQGENVHIRIGTRGAEAVNGYGSRQGQSAGIDHHKELVRRLGWTGPGSYRNRQLGRDGSIAIDRASGSTLCSVISIGISVTSIPRSCMCLGSA